MAKIKKMAEGIVVKDAPDHRTTIDGVMAKGKRATTNGKTLLIISMCMVQGMQIKTLLMRYVTLAKSAGLFIQSLMLGFSQIVLGVQPYLKSPFHVTVILVARYRAAVLSGFGCNRLLLLRCRGVCFPH